MSIELLDPEDPRERVLIAEILAGMSLNPSDKRSYEDKLKKAQKNLATYSSNLE